jgi:hypothetical protein
VHARFVGVIVFIIGLGIIFRNKIGIIQEFRNKIIKELSRNKIGIIPYFWRNSKHTRTMPPSWGCGVLHVICG